MATINAYLNFNGNCREAMTFYKECLGGDLNLQTVEGSPIEAQCPTAMKHQILHAALTRNGLLLMGSDMVGPEGYIKGNTMALSVNCDSSEEINSFFSNLSASGHIIDPLKKQFWGALFGVLTDKFGVRWMFNYDEKQQHQTV
ncbi:VOC family protein [Segetibacter koreensis]|uniref:VOC family protein n=1 Tax=Segetibacter koreensis TaxID=398037 RepID=UPI000365EEE4|nr:VOC family protein [Segetibacter koreensis]